MKKVYDNLTMAQVEAKLKEGIHWQDIVDMFEPTERTEFGQAYGYYQGTPSVCVLYFELADGYLMIDSPTDGSDTVCVETDLSTFDEWIEEYEDFEREQRDNGDET